MFDDIAPARLELHPITSNLCVGVPHLPRGVDTGAAAILQRALLNEVCARYDINNPYLWFYTPMAITFTGEIPASAIVYDCMDELSAFKDAPAELPELEGLLLNRADLVFTGGLSLYEANRARSMSVISAQHAVDWPSPPTRRQFRARGSGFLG